MTVAAERALFVIAFGSGERMSLDWRMAVMRQLDRCPHGVGTSKPVDGEDDLAEWAAIEKAYPRSSYSRLPSTPGISRAMPTDDLVDQFFAEPSGKRARAQ